LSEEKAKDAEAEPDYISLTSIHEKGQLPFVGSRNIRIDLDPFATSKKDREPVSFWARERFCQALRASAEDTRFCVVVTTQNMDVVEVMPPPRGGAA